MVIVPIVDIGLGNSSYVVDLGDGSALVVDPERDPAPYLEVAEQRPLADLLWNTVFDGGRTAPVQRRQQVRAPADITGERLSETERCSHLARARQKMKAAAGG